jgi:hypothetical protein
MNPDQNDPQADPFAGHLRRVRKFAVAAGVVGGVAGLCYSVAYLTQSENPKLRGVIAMPFVCGIGLALMVTGIGLLFAPAAFFMSDNGKEYLKLIGTGSTTAARIVILVFLLLGCGVLAVFAMGALQMAGIIDQPLRR